MADEQLEQRVSKLEREMVVLREHRVGTLEREWANIPDLIDLRFRQVDSKFGRVFAELDDMKKEMSEFKRELNDKVDALPRVLAEMIAERDRRR